MRSPRVVKLSDEFGQYSIRLVCECGYSRLCYPHELAKFAGWDAVLADLVRRLRCSKCGQKKCAAGCGRLARSAIAVSLLLLGVGVASGVICLLVAGGVLLLARAMPTWGATLIAAGVLALVSVTLLVAGRAHWRKTTLTRHKLVESVKQDLRILRDRAL